MREEAVTPEWNEQLSFVELFPPLTRGLRLQLRDDAPLVDAALATHVLDLRQISHSGRAGELIWSTSVALVRPLSALGAAPNDKPHPCHPASLRKLGPAPRTNRTQSRPLPSELHLLPQTINHHLWFDSVDRILTTAAYSISTPALHSVQVYMYRNKPTLSIYLSP